MLSTNNLVTKVESIPSYWVFQHYLNIQEKLTGQDVKIKSVFNPAENTPSFCIYVDASVMQYKFKDFSTGKQGDKIALVMDLFNLSFFDSTVKIVNDYNASIEKGDTQFINLKPEVKWKMNIVKTRQWIQDDADFWLSFNIGSSLLEEFNVKPLDYYTMNKVEDGEFKEIKFIKANTYGYFDKNNELIKIYQPFSKKHKFYNTQDYIQGFDQLNYDKPYLVICSSLKDAMCLKSLNYNLEVLAPSSENSVIKPYIINNLKTKYKKIITLFDNDEAGEKAIARYKQLFNINGLVYTRNKDISDAVKEHGIKIVNKELKPMIIETLKK